MNTIALSSPVAHRLIDETPIFWAELTEAQVGRSWTGYRRDGHDEWREVATVVHRDSHAITLACTVVSREECRDSEHTTVLVCALRGTARVAQCDEG